MDETSTEKVKYLRNEIAAREAELSTLKIQLAAAEAQAQAQAHAQDETWKWPLAPHEYERYSRQMIVPDFGLQGQLRLKKAKVLLVGAGGLGCPAAAYLAGAGVATLGLVDGDQVEVSNLHRQVAHATGRVGMSKVDSAITYLQDLNPTVTYKAHATHLTPRNAASIVSGYDVVLDCTDHPTSRYLVSDACVLLAKPLVSASAFQTSGQLIVLNDPPGRGPCYRCVFPRPPPPSSVVGCGEGGIVGPVVGVMGVLQALEAVKLIVRGGLEDQRGNEMKTTQSMLLFSGMADTPFRTVRMRGRRKGCFACDRETSTLTPEVLKTSVDYVQFCGVTEPVSLLRPDERVSATEYERTRHDAATKEHLLLDVREKEHFDLCHIPGSVNVPIGRFMSARGGQLPEGFPAGLSPSTPVYVVCRVGNDSQVAARKLQEAGLGGDGGRCIRDIEGGMRAWKASVDPSVPFI